MRWKSLLIAFVAAAAAATGLSLGLSLTRAGAVAVPPNPPVISNVPTTSPSFGAPGFTASVTTNSDGAPSVTSSTTAVCTVGVDNLTVSYVGAGTCTLTAHTAATINFLQGNGSAQTFTVNQATPSTPTISNLPTNAAFPGSFVATVSTTGDGTKTVTSNSTSVCTVSGLTVSFNSVGACSLTAHVGLGTNYTALDGSAQTFSVGQGAPTTPIISPIPASGTYGGSFVASVVTNGDGTKFVTSTGACTVGSDGLTVSYTGVGTCSVTAHVAAGTNYAAANGSAQTFSVLPVASSRPSISNLPTNAAFLGSFVATVSTTGDGTKTVTSNSTSVCTVSGLTVSFNSVGQCSLTAHVGTGTNYIAADGTAQTFNVGQAAPSPPTVTNLPTGATEFGSFTATVSTNGDGVKSVTSDSTGVCTVGSDGLTVTNVGFGICTLTANVGQGTSYLAASGSPQPFSVQPAARGYWLVGSDGGIFSFGAAGFHGSTGGLVLQRPVVGVTPSASRKGYWLVASDGGIFSFGDSDFYGSIPGLGLHPAGSHLPNSLNAPIVGMVPSSTGHGYFMIASDGGVFAFGDARFEGSCPGIGGCAGAAVAVMPDFSGKGYWLVTGTGAVYAFGDAPYYGGPPPETVPVVDAVSTPDGHGYWLLYANGAVAGFGDAGSFGAPLGYVNSYNPAAAIFPTADARGYWIATARGDVFTYGDAPYLGGMSASGLNGEIIAGFGF